MTALLADGTRAKVDPGRAGLVNRETTGASDRESLTEVAVDLDLHQGGSRRRDRTSGGRRRVC
jgi:hypothetical protein